MDIKNSISIFESEYDEKFDETKDEELRQEFVKTFPKDEMKNMELEDYALGKRDNNLCWWLEFNTINLGSIRGGSSAKYRIYFSKKNNKWEYVDKEFNDEREAWNSLRLNINNFIIKFEKGDYQGIKDEELDSTLKALKLKLLYMYFPDKVIPIYSESHLHRILIDFGFDEEKVKNYSSFEANLRLKEYKDNSLEFSSWSGLKFMRYIYSNKKHQVNIYKVAPGHDAVYWEECYNNGYICIGWDNIGDLTQYTSYEEFKESFIKNYGEEYKFNKRKITEKVNEIWTFYNLEPGNIIVANKGTSTVLGIGTVLESGYEFKNTRKKFKHIIHIDWEKNFEVKNIEAQKHWAFKTVAEVSKSLYDKICLDDGTEQNTVDLKRNEKVNFTEDEERFFTEFKKILERKKNVILYGPPGTGKTYLSLKYINWIENNNKKVEKEMCTFHPSFNYEDFIEGYKPSFSAIISSNVSSNFSACFTSIFLRSIISSRHTKTTVHTMIIAPHANSCWFRGRQKRTAIPPTASTRVSTIVSHILCLMPFPPRKKISHSINGLNIFMRCILDLFSQPGHIDCQRMLINKIFITVIKSFQKYLSCQDPPRIFHKKL